MNYLPLINIALLAATIIAVMWTQQEVVRELRRLTEATKINTETLLIVKGHVIQNARVVDATQKDSVAERETYRDQISHPQSPPC